MITGGVNRVGEVGKWRQRGERDATVLDYEERNWSSCLANVVLNYG